MTYGNKFILVVLLLSFFLLVGCTTKNWSYELYDGYKLKSMNNEVYLYKDEEKFKINDLSYNIKSFKFNSDVVCLKLNDGNFYMIYYVDGTIYGPFENKDTLEQSINSLSMTFENDFQDVLTLEGKVYE